jgi:hypothetical protein
VGDLVECCCDNAYAGWGVVVKSETKNSFVKVLFFDRKDDTFLEKEKITYMTHKGL